MTVLVVLGLVVAAVGIAAAAMLRNRPTPPALPPRATSGRRSKSPRHHRKRT